MQVVNKEEQRTVLEREDDAFAQVNERQVSKKLPRGSDVTTITCNALGGYHCSKKPFMGYQGRGRGSLGRSIE